MGAVRLLGGVVRTVEGGVRTTYNNSNPLLMIDLLNFLAGLHAELSSSSYN